MDETFDKVDFSYTCKASGTKKEILTLEGIEFGPGDQSQKATLQKATGEGTAESAAVIKPDVKAAAPEAGHKIIRDNQAGVFL